MSPKPKFTREEIIQAALTIVSQKGADALTAREVGEQLGSSARPIFTVFKNMEELQAMERFEARVAQTEPGIPLFKQVGIQMVTFGVQEPKLYQLLFMQEHGEAATFDDVFGQLGGTAERCIAAICQDYGLDAQDARTLFENVWIYTFGIGALCATRVCRFSPEQLGQMLTTEFQAMLLLVKSGKLRNKEEDR